MIFINGRFATQPLSGVQRFAREIVKALDVIASSAPDAAPRLALVVPEHAMLDMSLSAIAVVRHGRRTGHLWEQVDLYGATKRSLLINLCNSGPVLHRRSMTILHDAMIARTPENFSWRYRTAHRMLDRVLGWRSRIGTISRFSQRELQAVFGIDARFIVPNACDHILAVTGNVDVTKRFGLEPGRYLLLLGNRSANKNLRAAAAALMLLGDAAPSAVVVGAKPPLFKERDDTSGPDPLVYLGRLPDDDVVALYRNAAALLFPSTYEGFGIPPLEAMALGCPVLASDIPPVREVCENAVRYFDPSNAASIAAAISSVMNDPASREDLIKRGFERSKRFSWKASAEALLTAVRDADAE